MDWSNPHFAEPQWLWLALFAPVVIAVLHWRYSISRKKHLERVVAPALVAELSQSHSPARRLFKTVLLAAASAAIGVAMARPQWGQMEEKSQQVGRDIVFILDVSRSMLATDVTPNRLERARLAILDFVRQQGSGRVGLVAFAGQAFIQCPLTYDHNAFRETLLAVDEKAISVPGTDIGRALDEALRASEKKRGLKTMVLITDGEDLEKGAVRIAENLAKQEVIIYTVGVGTPMGSQIRVLNERGAPELLRDSKGQVVVSRLDEPTLAKIAEVTHGSYFPLGSMGEGFLKLNALLRKEASQPHKAPGQNMGVDRFHYPLLFALIVLAGEALVGTRRRKARSEGDVIKRSTTTLAALALLVATAGNVSAQPEVSVRKTFQQGTEELRQGKLAEAEALLESILTAQDESVQAPALYNLAHARFALGQEELKKSEKAGPMAARGRATTMEGEAVLTDGRDALQGNDVRRLVNSYMQGRGLLKDLRGSIKAVQKALQQYGNALTRWERASGDWKSAFELDPKNKDAQHNADVADQHIAKLIDSIRDLQQALAAMQGNRDQLKDMMEQMRGRIPKENMPPGAPGEDEEEDDQGGRLPPPGQQEPPGREGQERPVSPDEAGWILDGFKPGEDRQLPMGEGQPTPPRDRNRPTW